jgi:hypothetical protein
MHLWTPSSLITYDFLRALSANAFGVPLSVIGLLWYCGFVPLISAVILLSIIWMYFSSKDLMVRPAVTGNWKLYLVLIVPYVAASIACPIVAGLSHSAYLIAIRVLLGVWSTIFLTMFVITIHFGWKTVRRIQDKFIRKQQLRVYIIVSLFYFTCGSLMIIQSILLTRLDNHLVWELFVTSFYRVFSISLMLGGAIYAWVATSHLLKHPPGSGKAVASPTDTPGTLVISNGSLDSVDGKLDISGEASNIIGAETDLSA